MDQYADGVAAMFSDLLIGEDKQRMQHYREFLENFLRSRDCHHILDVACGTGFDSIMLLESNFKVTSVDISDKMLKYALKKRWNRRKEKAFDEWIIFKPEGGFDALICLGNSFPLLLDADGDMSDIKLALRNFHEMLKPNGYLVIDHRNYDAIVESGEWPDDSIYYKNIRYIIREQNKRWITTDAYIGAFDSNVKKGKFSVEDFEHFSFTTYPHQLEDFTNILKEVFGQDSKHEVYADYKPLDTVENPVFFIHFIQKGAD